jgi:hypothetical protein
VTVDESLKAHFERQKGEREYARTGAAADGPLAAGGGGDDSGGMDGLPERVTRLELRMDALADRLSRVETRLDRIEIRLDGLDTRLRGVEQTAAAISAKLDLLVASNAQLMAKLPSWWQMPTVIGATVAMLGLLWAAARHATTQGWL